MSCAFAPWSGVVSSKSCKWTWWLQLLQPQMGFLGCRQKLWSCTDELFFSDTPPISVCDIYQASIHPSNQPLSNSTYLCLCEGPSLGVSSHLVVSHQASIPSPPTDSYMDDLEPDFSLKKSQVSTGRTCSLHSGANQISSNTCGENTPVTNWTPSVIYLRLKRSSEKLLWTNPRGESCPSRWVWLKAQQDDLKFLCGFHS